MADQFDNNARSPNPDAEIDDPLAELARIIGYERPSGDTATTEGASQSSEFDLEAELMRELDVPLAPSIDELDRIEADEALDVILAEAPFEPQPDLEPEFESEATPDDAEGADDAFAYLPDGSHGDEMQDASSADRTPVEGQSSESLLKAIENEFPAEPDESAAADLLAGEGDHWFVSSEPEELPAEQPAAPDEQPVYEEDTPQYLTEAAVEVEDSVQPAYPADPIDDQVLADMARFELSSKDPRDPQVTVSTQNVADSGSGSGAGSDDTSRESALDFEEYLSTELDVFEQEYSMGEVGGVSDTGQQTPVPDTTPQSSDADDPFDVGNALEALNDSTLDDDVTVFDDAAEELLAAINDDVEFSGRSAAAGETPDDWSIESIEEGAAEELDEELGDMFGLPERSADPVAARPDAGDDLEFDLEKILADSFDGDDDWAEPVEIEPEIEAVAAVENDDWLSSYPTDDQPPQRDELTEAFQGLLPDEEPPISQAAKAAVPANTGDAGGNPAGQGDWLAGFDAADETGNEAAGRSPSSDYYFDADLISEPDEAVEIVPDIDVPELEHQEPQTVDPDYDIEIEREFADIIDRNEPSADSLPVDGGGAVSAAAEGWSRDTVTPRGYEVSDDYIALERELGSGVERTNFAAAATADLIGDRLSDTGDFSDASENDPAEADNRSRGPMVAIAVLALAVVAGIGGFGWSMLSGGDSTTADGGPRIIRADKEPVKVLPENPGGVTVPNQDKAVYDRVAGGSESSTGQPALVNSAEEPVDVVQRTLDPEILPLEGRTDFSVKSEERLSAETNGEETAAGGAPAPVVSPRKVRTMIVKPDGSIVAREVSEPETVAPQTSEAAPQALAAASSQDAAAAGPVADGEAAETAASTQTQAGSQDQAAATETPAAEGTLAPVRVVTTQPIRPVANAPVPQGRPADQPVNVVGTVSQAGRVGAAPATTTAPTATAAPVAPAPVTPAPVEVASAPQAAAPAANPGGYYVQIASQPTVEGAQASWQTLSNRYSSVLGGRGVDIQRADIPGKGVFHRVRVPAGTRDQANALCTRYKAAGGSCFVSR
jgi:hypothetical protein